MKRLYMISALAAALGLFAPPAAHAQVARVLRIDGAAMVEHPGQKRRLLGAGEQLNEKAVVHVAKESFVMLEFRDESRVTLRPNTVFRVEAFVDDAPENIRFGLAKGGLRAVSGLVGKRKPESIQVNTSSAWIGIRGTEFDLRLCDKDCGSEDRAATKPLVSRTPVAGRVVEIDGIAIATGPTLPTRMLSPGSIIYERDSIATAPDAHVALAFADGSRASVSANSVVAVQQFRFDPAQPGQYAAQLRLLDGGLRVMTGAIAEHRPEAYRVETTAGALEPRGRLFDAFCTGACVDRMSNAPAELARMKQMADRAIAQANAEAGVKTAPGGTTLAPPAVAQDGLVVHAIEGSVMAGTNGERVEVKQGGTAVFSERGAAPRFATQTFAYIAQNKAPRPDRVPVDPGLFDPKKAQSYEPGLYVWVRDGAITLNPNERAAAGPPEPVRLAAASNTTIDAGSLLRTGQSVTLQAGQSARLDATGNVFQLPAPPPFMQFDPTPTPTRLSVPVNQQPTAFQAKDGSSTGTCAP